MNSRGFTAAVSLGMGLILVLLGIIGTPSGPALATDKAQGVDQIAADDEIVILINGMPATSSGVAGDGTAADSLAGLRKGESLLLRDEAAVAGPAAVMADFVNGGFENGADGSWKEYSLNGWPLILMEEYLLAPPHRGRWGVWLGGDNDELSAIRQQVKIPSKKADAVMSWWLWIASEDTCGHDYFYLWINDSYGRLDLCATKNTGGWARATSDLRDWAGQTVWVQLSVETNGSLNSNAFVDDVAFEALQPALTRAHLPLVHRGKPAVQTFAPSCSASNGYCEPFNAWRDAYGPLKPGTAYKAYPNDQTDYYYFTVDRRRAVTVQITNYQADGQMVIRNEQLAELAKDVNVPPGWDGTMTVSGLDLQPGKYFIQVFTTAQHNQNHQYTLKVNQ